jgi:hypothetical protein
LPAELSRSRAGADAYLRELWDLWWRERDQYAEALLPGGAWRLHGLRPANHPLRRLALVAHWWADGTIPARLESWFMAANGEQPPAAAGLLKVLRPQEDDFWSWHWTLRGRRLDQPQPLAGPDRMTDLAVNVLLPWFWARARQGGQRPMMAQAERRYLAWPPAQDNSVLRLAQRRLLGGGGCRWRTAAQQQGLLQIVRDFCDHSDPLCSDCPFPECLAGTRAPGA